MSEKIVLDTNVLLRFLVDEPVHQADKAEALLLAAESGDVVLCVDGVVLAETIFVAESFYQLDGRELAEQLHGLLNRPAFEIDNKNVVLEALRRYQAGTHHFVDAYVASKAIEMDCKLATFDKRLAKHVGGKPL